MGPNNIIDVLWIETYIPHILFKKDIGMITTG